MLATAAGDKIVNADDLVSARQQQVGEVRAKKAGGPGDDGRGLFFSHGQILNLNSTGKAYLSAPPIQ